MSLLYWSAARRRPRHSALWGLFERSRHLRQRRLLKYTVVLFSSRVIDYKLNQELTYTEQRLRCRLLYFDSREEKIVVWTVVWVHCASWKPVIATASGVRTPCSPPKQRRAKARLFALAKGPGRERRSMETWHCDCQAKPWDIHLWGFFFLGFQLLQAFTFNKQYDNNSDKRLSIISLSSIEMCIHLIWYYKDVNKSKFAEVSYNGIK